MHVVLFVEVMIVPRFLFRTLLFGFVGVAVCGGSISAQSATSPAGAPPSGLTLDAALAAALAQHPLVDAARARVAAAQGSRLTATTLPNPIATYWMENARFPGQASSTLDHEISAYATMPLEPFLQRSSRTAQAGAELRATEAGVVTAERDVVSLVQRQWKALRPGVAAADLSPVSPETP